MIFFIIILISYFQFASFRRMVAEILVCSCERESELVWWQYL